MGSRKRPRGSAGKGKRRTKVAKSPTLKTEKTQQELAYVIGRSARQVHNLTVDGVFVRVPSAADPTKLVYPWPASVQRWIDHQVEQRAPKAPEAISPATRERNADASIKEFKLAQLRGEFVERAAYREELRRVLERIAITLDTFPGKHGPRLPGDGPVAEKVAALRAVARDLRAELRRAGHTAPDGAAA